MRDIARRERERERERERASEWAGGGQRKSAQATQHTLESKTNKRRRRGRRKERDDHKSPRTQTCYPRDLLCAGTNDSHADAWNRPRADQPLDLSTHYGEKGKLNPKAFRRRREGGREGGKVGQAAFLAPGFWSSLCSSHSSIRMSVDISNLDTWLVGHLGYPYLSLYLIMTLQRKVAVWDLKIYGKETAAVLIETWKFIKRSQF